MIKVAVSGVHSSGKSTEVFRLANRYKIDFPNKRVGVLQENIVDCPLPINESTEVMSQYWLVCDQITKEIEFSKKYDILVCDRSVFDPICYCIAVAKFPGNEFKKFELLKASQFLYKFLSSFGDTYDEIFLMNTPKICIEDGLRSVNLEFRDIVKEQFDMLFERLLKEKIVKKVTKI